MLILGVRRWQLLAKVVMCLAKLPYFSRSCHLACAKIVIKARGLAIFPPTRVTHFYGNADNYHMYDTSTGQSLMFFDDKFSYVRVATSGCRR